MTQKDDDDGDNDGDKLNIWIYILLIGPLVFYSALFFFLLGDTTFSHCRTLSPLVRLGECVEHKRSGLHIHVILKISSSAHF